VKRAHKPRESHHAQVSAPNLILPIAITVDKLANPHGSRRQTGVYQWLNMMSNGDLRFELAVSSGKFRNQGGPNASLALD
jgi:hypothetical protein